jgi:hypothetical protein
MTMAGDGRGLEGFSFPGPAQIASSAASLAAPQSRAKVPQAPQYSQMAWMALGRNRDLTGLNGARPGKLTMEEVKRHSTEEVRVALLTASLRAQVGECGRSTLTAVLARRSLS